MFFHTFLVLKKDSSISHSKQNNLGSVCVHAHEVVGFLLRKKGNDQLTDANGELGEHIVLHYSSNSWKVTID